MNLNLEIHLEYELHKNDAQYYPQHFLHVIHLFYIHLHLMHF